MSISDGFALVGAPYDDDSGITSGSAYIFRWNGSNWMQEQKLLASDGAEGDVFGVALSISGDVCLLGAPGDDDNGQDSGAAYIFYWNGSSWIEEQKLTASDGHAYDSLGSSVFIWGDKSLVGTHYDDDKGPDSGSAYVYDHVILTPPMPDIKANASDGPLTIGQGDQLLITISMEASDYAGDPMDWWCVTNTPFGWYYYDIGAQWLSGLKVTYSGPLMDTTELEVLNNSALPQGAYRFYFGVDDMMNGSLDGNKYYDSVDVTIMP